MKHGYIRKCCHFLKEYRKTPNNLVTVTKTERTKKKFSGLVAVIKCLGVVIFRPLNPEKVVFRAFFFYGMFGPYIINIEIILVICTNTTEVNKKLKYRCLI